jgi:hypothetical protein
MCDTKCDVHRARAFAAPPEIYDGAFWRPLLFAAQQRPKLIIFSVYRHGCVLTQSKLAARAKLIDGRFIIIILLTVPSYP